MDSQYVFQFCGACLGDLIANGTVLTVDPVQNIEPLDVVAVILDVENGGPFLPFANAIAASGFPGVCKLFLSTAQTLEGEECFLVAQLDPPLVSPIPRSAVKAMHRVVGGDVGEEDFSRLSPRDQYALNLLLPFADQHGSQSINPEWKPEVLAH